MDDRPSYEDMDRAKRAIEQFNPKEYKQDTTIETTALGKVLDAQEEQLGNLHEALDQLFTCLEMVLPSVPLENPETEPDECFGSSVAIRRLQSNLESTRRAMKRVCSLIRDLEV